MADFGQAIAVVLADEGGGYNPDDNGRGPSRWGVTLATARGFSLPWTAETIQQLTRTEAEAFYEQYFWWGPHIEEIEDQAVATKMLDLMINVGPIAIEWMQEAAGVEPDMIIGPETITAVNSMSSEGLLAGIKLRGATYYNNLAVKDPAKYGNDLAGWLARLAK